MPPARPADRRVLYETVLAPDGARVIPRSRDYPAGQVRAFEPRHVHDVAASQSSAISLHVYTPALTRMTRYALDDGVLVPLASEQAGADW